MEIKDQVILNKPEVGSKYVLFEIININQEMKRCVIKPKDIDFSVAPLELVSFDEIIKI